MDLILLGFSEALAIENLFFCFLGVFLGTAIGVLPGVGALAAVSLLLPMTFYLGPTTALVMLAGVYYGAEYGGSTASILLNLPGTPSNAITCLDGYPMAQQGRAGVALFVTTIASFCGGTVGVVLLMLLTPAIVTVSTAFGPAEYFAIMLFGLIAAGTIGRGSAVKGLAMALLGVLLGTVGADLNTSVDRYTFGLVELIDGVGLVPVAMGIFGVSEIIGSVRMSHERVPQAISLRSMLPTRKDVREALGPIFRGASVGSVVGPLPGAGPTVAALMSYAIEKRVSKSPEKFGTGAIEGIAGPESANNAAAQTAFIPTLALGIPGSATMALMIGALMVHGINPGPQLVSNNPEIFWGLVASFWIGNLLLLVLNIPLIGIWVSILNTPYKYLYPIIIVLICIGVFSLNNSVFGVWLVMFFGLIGYGMRFFGFEPAPLLIGFILGPMVEENFRRAMLLGRGDVTYLVSSPVAATLMFATFLMLAWTIYATLYNGAGAGKFAPHVENEK